jgi:hypothetical protein
MTTSAYKIGKRYIFRTLTFCNIGTITDTTKEDLILKNVIWVRDTGSWQDFLVGKFDTLSPKEFEFFPEDTEVILNKSQIVDACEFNHIIERR